MSNRAALLISEIYTDINLIILYNDTHIHFFL